MIALVNSDRDDQTRRTRKAACVMVSRSSDETRRTSRAPDVWGKIPPRNKNFTGREELLLRLREGLAGDVTAVVPHALHGLGGVGKTAVAVEYAHRFRSDYDLIWWIPADQSVLVRASLAGIAPVLGLPPATATGIEDAANAVLDALRRGDPYDRWLLIFDNADQPEDINEVIPRGPGHVLITSRNHRWQGVVDTVPVDVFSREESMTFLAKRVPRGIDKTDADHLAEALGDLPLALEQAGALQAETGMSVGEYLRLLEARTSSLLAEGKPTEYPLPMTAAWGLSVARLNEQLPEALELLRCCALFGPEPIPRDVFSPREAHVGRSLADLLSDPIRLSRAFGELGRYALARIDTASRTIQVHRLIQALLRDELEAAEQQRIRVDVHRLLAAAAPESPDDPAGWQRYSDLLAHILPAAVADSRDPVIRDFSLDIVRYLYLSGNYPSARAYVERFIERWSLDSGPENMHVLQARRHLGMTLRELGEYNAAYELNQTTLVAMRQLSDPEQGAVLLLINSIGADLRARGEFPRAREHDEESRSQHEAAFGQADRRTMTAVNNLALDYGLISRYETARDLHQHAYLGQRAANPAASTASIMAAWSSLARTVRLCGDYAEACDLGEEAYAYGVQQLGAVHPWTLRSAKDLSIAWRMAGDRDRALELAVDVHSRYVRLYELDHPDTLAAAMCLANIRRSIGEVEAAFELLADSVQRYSKIYGPEHPYTYGCAGNLALLPRVLGEVQEARELNQQALDGLERRLGRDHDYPLTVAINLASDLTALGDLEGAVRLGHDTLRRLGALLGETHPTTLACASNLSADLLASGAEAEGTRLFEDTMEEYARTLGREHPDVQVAAAHRHLDYDFDPPPI
jgi:hypothetical protein